MQRTFTAYGEELRRVDRFKYLGRMLSYDDSDTPAVRRNLKKARASWDSMRPRYLNLSTRRSSSP